VFAHPSRNEGLPTSVLEVAAMGIPCVVTDATNVGDAIREYNAGAVIAEPDRPAIKIAANIGPNSRTIATPSKLTINESPP
ncbi:MAG: glycosyltransferase, partial [Undibacterium sp.]|nr:glycosyltransferase [Undibacterium sp.]